MRTESETRHLLQRSIISLLDYCRRNDWSGFDPYDGLNSRIFKALPLVQNRIGRLIFIQAMKRSPLNLRRILLVPKGENPKGLAVFCSALFKLCETGLVKDEDIVLRLLRRLVDLKSRSSPYFCWGYNFDWQTRGLFIPKFTPNIICMTFAANALLDAYDRLRDSKYLNMAISAGDFLLTGLNITETSDEICFSYTPLDRSRVHNANLLGAAFLSRLYSLTHENKFLEPACRAVRFTVHRQREDGSWSYGEDRTQKWIDNFHTGYNLVALRRFSAYSGATDWTENIRKGFQFYRENLFTADGLPKYRHDQEYPVDIHSVAQSIITLVEFKAFDEGNIDLAKHIFAWSSKTMQGKDGYFFYQKHRFFKNRISYMRWSQAWMLLALSSLLKACDWGDEHV